MQHRVQEASVHLTVQITEIKVQYYSVRNDNISTCSMSNNKIIISSLHKGVFTRLYLGEKCKCAVFLKKKKRNKKKINGTIKMESRK